MNTLGELSSRRFRALGFVWYTSSKSKPNGNVIKGRIPEKVTGSYLRQCLTVDRKITAER